VAAWWDSQRSTAASNSQPASCCLFSRSCCTRTSMPSDRSQRLPAHSTSGRRNERSIPRPVRLTACHSMHGSGERTADGQELAILRTSRSPVAPIGAVALVRCKSLNSALLLASALTTMYLALGRRGGAPVQQPALLGDGIRGGPSSRQRHRRLAAVQEDALGGATDSSAVIHVT
jgi:hypothetical protein